MVVIASIVMQRMKVDSIFGAAKGFFRLNENVVLTLGG